MEGLSEKLRAHRNLSSSNSSEEELDRAASLSEYVKGLIQGVNLYFIPSNVLARCQALIPQLKNIANQDPPVWIPSQVPSITANLEELIGLLKPHVLAVTKDDVPVLIKATLEVETETDDARRLIKEGIAHVSKEKATLATQLGAISNDVGAIQEAKGKANIALSDMQETFQSFSSLHTESVSAMEKASASIQSCKDEIEVSHKRSIAAKDKIEEFEVKVFGAEPNTKEGLQFRLNELIGQMEEIKKELKDYLPSAASKGLSEAMADAHEKSARSKHFLQWAFVGSLVSVVLLFIGSSYLLPDIYEKLVQVESPELRLLLSLLTRLSITFPAIWLALVALAKVNEQQRFEQEYLHKASVAKSYIAFKTQIDKMGLSDNDLAQKLLGIAINTLNRNAADSLDKQTKNDTPIEAAFDLVEKAKNIVLPKP